MKSDQSGEDQQYWDDDQLPSQGWGWKGKRMGLSENIFNKGIWLVTTRDTKQQWFKCNRGVSGT